MKKHKLLAIISAITMTAVSSIPVLSSASYNPITLDNNSSLIKSYLKDNNYELIDDKGIFETYADDFADSYQVYFKTDCNFQCFYVVSISEKYNKAFFTPLCVSQNDLLTLYDFYAYDYVTLDEGVKEIQSYIDENNLDCKVVKVICNDDVEEEFSAVLQGYKIIPNNDITLQEHIELASKLKKGLGLIPFLTGFQSDVTIDLESTIAGDVNLDGTVDVADIVAISAYTGDAENNSFKSEQQIINGDVHNKGDGLTANDALMIQQYLAGIIDGLE